MRSIPRLGSLPKQVGNFCKPPTRSPPPHALAASAATDEPHKPHRPGRWSSRWSQGTSPFSLMAFAEWHGRQSGAQSAVAQKIAMSPRCGRTWSTSTAGTRRPAALQWTQIGFAAKNPSRARRHAVP